MVRAQAVWQMQPWNRWDRWGRDIRLKSPLKRHANMHTRTHRSLQHRNKLPVAHWQKTFSHEAVCLPQEVRMKEHLSRSYPKTPCSSLSLPHSLSLCLLSLSLSLFEWLRLSKHMTWEDLPLICLKWKGEGRSEKGVTLRFALIVHPPVTLTVNDLDSGEGVLNGDNLWTLYCATEINISSSSSSTAASNTVNF